MMPLFLKEYKSDENFFEKLPNLPKNKTFTNDSTLTWKDFEWVCKLTDLPVIAKGK
jgi:hypothetical protein